MATIAQIEEFVACARKIGEYGLTVCSSGNLSIKINDNEVLVSGTGSWVPELTADNVSVVSFPDGKVLNGVRPSIESVFHLGVLKERAPEVNCVLHFQSPYATAVACMKKRPENFNFTAECPIHVGREIPMIPYLRPGSPELAEQVIAALKEHDSAMLLKHGQVVCGKDFRQALERAMFFEMACRIAVLNGDNIDPLTPTEIGDIDKYILAKSK